MFLLVIISFVFSLMAILWVRRWFADHAFNYDALAPQRFHAGAVSRLGGVGMFMGWCAGILSSLVFATWDVQNGVRLTMGDALLFMGLACVAVVVGACEDVTQRVAVRWRLLMTGGLGVLAVVAWGLGIPNLGMPVLDGLWLAMPWMGGALAVLAIMGLPHAFNIIDGYNGLAGLVAVLVCMALAHVALQVGDRELAVVVLCLAGATVGFLIWNYPKGLIFAGDGGAYLWGTVIALVSIALVQRHPQVSPWFPFLLLIYPVWETFFSIYRKWARGVSPGMADSMHLHQLIYRRLVKAVMGQEEAKRLLERNNKTTPYLAALAAMSVVPAMLFWSTTWALQLFCVLFVATYVGAYVTIVRFKVPKWLRR